MAKPRKKPPLRTVQIYCSGCRALLFKYRKGGKGSLIKCFIERITEDHTNKTGTCPGCGQVFARETMIRGTPAYKIIGGKVQVK
ncbi:hypothetical protein [Lacimicrobium alkaliphilum]|uniref:hypothetical protein n=1 Tax=Lacimicrobium alkaliphilum TaxID=1526571 RepID=UPI000BFED4C6|nr:hypothetical protein [Lacimicrobium alkaliphilum]